MDGRSRETSATFWYHWPRSANPNPTCRIGHCPHPAIEGSELCEGHDYGVNEARARAADELAVLRRSGRPGTRRDG